VSITLRVSGSSLRRSVVQAAAIALAGLACGGAQAQTAPQLLPSTVKLVAGGGTTAIAAGATCPVSGNKSTDAYGDGCLASEIQLVTAGTKIYYGEFPGYAIADSTGAVFFSDGNNGLVRRVDPVTGIVTAIAGGATSNPASGSACTGGTSTDANGDGCLSTAVKLVNPAALAFDAVGNLYVSDIGKEDIRKITATGGLVTNGGVISNVAGQSTYGYNVNNTSTNGPVNAATQSYVDEPFGMSFDAAGNLYFADEGENAIEVINLTGASEVLQGFTIPAGTIEKLMGTKSGVDCPAPTAPSATAQSPTYPPPTPPTASASFPEPRRPTPATSTLPTNIPTTLPRSTRPTSSTTMPASSVPLWPSPTPSAPSPAAFPSAAPSA
jgi:sugar lactone lactonase YvrE